MSLTNKRRFMLFSAKINGLGLLFEKFSRYPVYLEFTERFQGV